MISVNKIDDVIKLAQIKEVTYNKNTYASYSSLNSKLKTNLRKLSFDDVRSLRIIMCIGKDKDHNRDLKPIKIYENLKYFVEKLGRKTKAFEIYQILENLPLSNYLINGKKILKLGFWHINYFSN